MVWLIKTRLQGFCRCWAGQNKKVAESGDRHFGEKRKEYQGSSLGQGGGRVLLQVNRPVRWDDDETVLKIRPGTPILPTRLFS